MQVNETGTESVEPQSVEPQGELVAADEAASGDAIEQNAAARFESNRRYDHRPAIENLDRPTLVLTTRTQLPPKSGPAWSTLGLVAGLVVAALGAGALVGFWIASGRDQADGPASVLATPALADGAEPTTSVATSVPALEPSTSAAGETSAAVELDLSDDSDFLAALGGLDLDELAFLPGEINLTPGGIMELTRLADVLSAHPRQPFELRVRTYSESTPGRNHGLSVHQANALTTMLTTAGVDAGRMSVVGLGSHGTVRPTAAAAMFIDTTDEVVAEELATRGPLVLNEPFTGQLDESSLELLASLTASAEGEFSLVAYSWSEPNADANHDVSHHLLDAAAAWLVNAGVGSERIDTVGLGSAAAPLTERSTVVTVEAGEAAAIAVELAALEVDAVSFEPDTTTLTSSATETLDVVAEVMANNPEVQVEIAVHFYGASTGQSNHDTSQVQANAIGAYLSSSGVSDDRLQLMAHGDPPHFAVPGREHVVTFTVIR